jgi:serine/threonine-protein kinase
MANHTIRLPKGEWRFDDLHCLGRPGGFGQVFRGNGADGSVAIKRLHLTAAQAAHRELTISEHLARTSLTNVVQILDSGQDAESDRYFLIMPVCDRNLDEEIQLCPGGLTLSMALPIVRHILQGLQEVAEIVHRDLKPANILFHEGFGKLPILASPNSSKTQPLLKHYVTA